MPPVRRRNLPPAEVRPQVSLQGPSMAASCARGTRWFGRLSPIHRCRRGLRSIFVPAIRSPQNQQQEPRRHGDQREQNQNQRPTTGGTEKQRERRCSRVLTVLTVWTESSSSSVISRGERSRKNRITMASRSSIRSAAMSCTSVDCASSAESMRSIRGGRRGRFAFRTRGIPGRSRQLRSPPKDQTSRAPSSSESDQTARGGYLAACRRSAPKLASSRSAGFFSFTWRTYCPLPMSSLPGSVSDEPRKNPNCTWSSAE
jgi:hypothetical protein